MYTNQAARATNAALQSLQSDMDHSSADHYKRRRDQGREQLEKREGRPERWIRSLKRKQEERARTDHPAKYSYTSIPVIKRGPVDTLILGDSIIKYVDSIRHAQVVSFPGISCSQLEQLIARNKIPELRDQEVILIHCGTNDLDQHWRDTVFNISRLLVAITDKLPNAKIIWSSILPRPARTFYHDEESVRRNIIRINKEIKKRQRHLKITTCPSHTSFHYAKSPITKLFARDYLHLKTKGTLLLRELYRQHLLRLRDLWGMETWPVNEIPQLETRIERNWLSLLCEERR